MVADQKQRDAVGDGIQFEEFKGLFWRAFAKLAAQGFVVPPDEAQDVIHDFFIEEWGGIRSRYDASRGKFSSYLFIAFFRFARQRAIRLQNLRAQLVASGLFEPEDPRAQDPSEVSEHHEQLDSLRAALRSLPSDEREVLGGFLNQTRFSERLLAKRHHVSRYRLREILIDALGRVSTSLGWHPDVARSLDRKIVESLWRDGQTVQAAAARFGIPADQIRAVRTSYVEQLLKAIRGQSASSGEGTGKMKDALQFLKNALLGAPSKSVIREIQANAESIRGALENEEILFRQQELALLDEHSPWVAQVFEALAGDEPTPEATTELVRTIEAIHQNEEDEIAEAFVTALETLPERFHLWSKWFPAVDAADVQGFAKWAVTLRVVQTALRQSKSPSVVEKLLEFHLIPSTFIEAARGIELLANRLIQTAAGPVDRVKDHSGELQRLYCWIRSRKDSGQSPGLNLVDHEFDSASEEAVGAAPYGLLVAQVRGTPVCPPDAAAPMVSWVIQAAQHKPFLFRGFKVETSKKDRICITQSATSAGNDLVARWGKRTEEAPRKAAVCV